MRITHINYFRDLVNSIGLIDKTTKEILYPFKDRLLEIYPSEQDIIEQFPCAVLLSKRNQNLFDSRKKDSTRIEPVFRDSKKFNRYFVKHFSQTFNYEIHFWTKDPSYDLFSDPVNPGIIDQALLFISKNGTRAYKPDGVNVPEIFFDIDPGDDFLDTGSVKDKAVYQLGLNVIIRDGLYTLQEEETLYNTKFVIDENVVVEGK